MDVVYVVRDGPNRELSWSLRSLINLPHDEVWVFGGLPDTVKGVRHVPVPQVPGAKWGNAKAGLRAAVDHPDVSDPFVLMNDDFYVIRPVSVVEAWSTGPFAAWIADYGRTSYAGWMHCTLDLIRAHGYPEPWNLELHTPIVYDKWGIAKALDLCEAQPRLHERTIYGAVVGVEPVVVGDDVKIYNRRTPWPDGPYVSSSEGTFHRVEPRLAVQFPAPCVYETGAPVRGGPASAPDVGRAASSNERASYASA